MIYFSVKDGLKIAGKNFRPCICYKISELHRASIERLAAEGKVRIHDKQVFFQNGKILETKAVNKVKKAKKNTAKIEVKETTEETVTSTETTENEF
jgi:hypothetical protein